MKKKNILPVFVLFAMLLSIFPKEVSASNQPAPPPGDMFQLPWELGQAWVAYDGFDNGTRRSPTSPHNYRLGGALDFAPHNNMVVGEDTSNFWVNAAADGVVTTVSSCHIVISHGNGWTTEYWHLANIQVNISDVVTRNQRLAVIADNVRVQVCTGNRFPGPHLHFVMRPNTAETIFAGWRINFNTTTNVTTFTKNGQTLGLFQPLLNSFAGVPTSTPTRTPTSTLTRTSTPTFTNTPTPTNTLAITNTPTSTNTLVTTNTSTATNTLVVTNTNTATLTPIVSDTPTFTATSVITDTPTATSTLSITNTPTPTNTVIIPDTPTSTVTPIITNTSSVPTNTSTSTSVPVVTDTPVFTHTPTTTATGGPTFPFVQTDTTNENLVIGQSSLVEVSLNNISTGGYTGAEFTCTYNATLLSVNNITVLPPVSTNSITAINGPQNGSFIVAIVGTNGYRIDNISVVFTFTVTGLQTGQTPVECTARVAQVQGVYQDIAHIGEIVNITTVTPSPTSTTTGPLPPQLNGQVFASKPVTIRLYNLDTTLAATIVANPDGTFISNASAGSYTIVASAEGFLNAQGSITLTNGVTTTMPTINLIPGDVDGNSVINQLDALTIGMNYNGTTPTAADLNNDGIINVLDLQMLALHYGQSGALAW